MSSDSSSDVRSDLVAAASAIGLGAFVTGKVKAAAQAGAADAAIEEDRRGWGNPG